MTEPAVPASAIKGLFLDTSTLIMETAEKNTESIISLGLGLYECIKTGGRIFICGNGGSSAQADHMAAELLVRLNPDIDRAPLPAMSLNMDMASMTACGNDYSFQGYFARMLMAHGREGDALIVISTSGKSPNIHLALQRANDLKMKRFGIFGQFPNPAGKLVDGAVWVPSDRTAKIQEVHVVICHVLCQIIEDLYLYDTTGRHAGE